VKINRARIELAERLSRARRDSSDEQRMVVPWLRIDNLGRRFAQLSEGVVDGCLIALEARLAAMRRHDEREHAPRATVGQRAHRVGNVRFPVAHPDGDWRAHAFLLELRAQSRCLTHREIVVRRAAAEKIVMMHDLLVALARYRPSAQNVVEKRPHFVGAGRSAEANHQHRVAFCLRGHRVSARSSDEPHR